MPSSIILDAIRSSNEFLDLPLIPEDCDETDALKRLAETRTTCQAHGWTSILPRLDFFTKKIQACVAQAYQDSST